MRILQFDNPEDLVVLTRKASKVRDLSDFEKIGALEEEMYKICRQNKGVGLSANQIGMSEKFFVICSKTLRELFINPVMSGIGDGVIHTQEGCLSNGRRTTFKKRLKSIEAVYQDKFGEEKFIRLTGSDAVIFQHEMDHMYGKVV